MSIPIDFQPGHGMTIAGQNGAGKSVLATSIANRWDRVLVYDPKLDPASLIPNAAVCYGVKAALAALPGRVIYRPRADEIHRIGRVFDELVRKVMKLTAHAIVIHELGDLAASDRELAPYLSACMRQRRSLRIPMILVTQRPVNIPRLALSESQHAVAFHLVDRQDRLRMAEVMGPEVVDRPVPNDHSFWYRGPDLALVRVAPIPLARPPEQIV